MRKSPDFILNERKLEIVYSYKYLGVHFNYNGKFTVAKNELFRKRSRAMFSLLRKCKKLRLSVDIQLQLFGVLVKPVLLYGCKVWTPPEGIGVVEKPSYQIKLSNAIYQLLLKWYNDGIFVSQWITSVKRILESCGFPGVWRNQTIPCSSEN